MTYPSGILPYCVSVCSQEFSCSLVSVVGLLSSAALLHLFFGCGPPGPNGSMQRGTSKMNRTWWLWTGRPGIHGNSALGNTRLLLSKEEEWPQIVTWRIMNDYIGTKGCPGITKLFMIYYVQGFHDPWLSILLVARRTNVLLSSTASIVIFILIRAMRFITKDHISL